MKRPVVLPADVYDTLELSALAFGGIGKGYCVDEEGNPLCAAGHCDETYLEGPMLHALRLAIGHGIERPIGDWNDAAFNPDEGRIPFEEWCRRLNVVRGEA